MDLNAVCQVNIFYMMNNATNQKVTKSHHQIKPGNNMYCWSPDPSSTGW